MKQQKIVIAPVVISISLAISCLPAQAQNTQNKNNSQLTQNNNSQRRKDNRGANRKSGNDRGQCPAINSVNNTLTALVSDQDTALTLSDSPTLLFYVPYNSNPPLKAQFSLRDEQGYNVIKPPMIITLSNTPGIVKVNLPKTLVKNQFYHWSLAILCQDKNKKDNSKNPGVDGWIKLVSPSPQLANQLQRNVSPRELANLYKQEGILTDALATLAAIRSQDPKAEKDWQNLLKLLNLSELSSEKITQ